MSPYATELAQARLSALRALTELLETTDSPAEKRRAAAAILKSPRPDACDDAISYDHAPHPPDPAPANPHGQAPSQPSLAPPSPLADRLNCLGLDLNVGLSPTGDQNIPLPLRSALRKLSRAP